MIDDRRFAEGTWQLDPDTARQTCIGDILTRFCNASRVSWRSSSLSDVQIRLDHHPSIDKVEWEADLHHCLKCIKYSAYVTLATPEPLTNVSPEAGYAQYLVSGDEEPLKCLSRRACIIQILSRFSEASRDLEATTIRLQEYLAEDRMIRRVTFYLPQKVYAHAQTPGFRTKACVTLNDKDPNATPGQFPGQQYVPGDWHETADESKKSCIVKILARCSDLPRSSYSFSTDLTELEKRLAEEASILGVNWKSVERQLKTLLVRQSAYVTLNDGEFLADADPDLLTPTDGKSLADTFTDSDNFTDDGHAAALDALAIHQDSQATAVAALLKAQEVFRKVFPERSVPASVTAWMKDLQRVLDQSG